VSCYWKWKEKPRLFLDRVCVWRTWHTPCPRFIIRTVVTIFTPSSCSRNFIFSHCVYVLLLSRYWLLPFLNWLVFVVETGCVYWDVEITFVCIITHGLEPGFSPSTTVFPCQYHSTIAGYTFIRLPPTLYNVFLPVIQFSRVSTIPPLLHTHSSIYHPRCIMFFSQYFSFPLSVSFHHCSILIHPSTTHAV